MKYSILSLLLLAVMYSCNQTAKPTESILVDTIAEKNQISMLLDSFNKAAANANFKEYFEFYTDNAIFTGTDATERWDKKPFMIWAKPFFDKGKAWSFTVLKRHIYLDTTARFAWFDELLNTQMKICRGSGVLLKQGNAWKVQQYILSTTIPNEIMDSIIKIKAPIEDVLIKQLLEKK